MKKRCKLSLGQGLLCLLLFVFSLAFIIPFLQVVISSFASQSDLMQYGAYSIIPRSLDVSAYQALLSSNTIGHAALISAARTLLGTLFCMVVTSLLAYGLSRKALAGKNAMITIIFITMIFSGGLIPTYMVINALKLTNTFWAMIFPSLVTTYNFILMKTFFQSIPASLEEAATIDGASQFRYFLSVAIPLSKPMLATISLFYAVSHWNSWFDAAIYITDYPKMPLQVILRDTIVKFSETTLNLGFSLMPSSQRPSSVAMRSALIVVTTVPIVCIYPFLQKYFVKGIMIGAIKG